MVWFLRVEQGKGRKDRYVMLSPHLSNAAHLVESRDDRRAGLFPGRDPSTADDDAPAQSRLPTPHNMAEIQKRRIAPTHCATLRDPPAGAKTSI